MTSNAPCVHIGAVTPVKLPKRRECEDCVKIGAKWVHLRTCQECGGTRCCDDSPNKHASKHARGTGHPVIAVMTSPMAAPSWPSMPPADDSPDTGVSGPPCVARRRALTSRVDVAR